MRPCRFFTYSHLLAAAQLAAAVACSSREDSCMQQQQHVEHVHTSCTHSFTYMPQSHIISSQLLRPLRFYPYAVGWFCHMHAHIISSPFLRPLPFCSYAVGWFCQSQQACQRAHDALQPDRRRSPHSDKPGRHCHLRIASQLWLQPRLELPQCY